MIAAVSPARPNGAAPRAFVGTIWEDAASAAAAHAPYLGRLISRRGDLCVDIDEAWPDRLVADAISRANAIAATPPAIEEGMRVLRQAKDAVHLAAAIADLAGAWPLPMVTERLSDFADAAMRAALALAAREQGRLSGDACSGEFGPVAGFSLIAMGKLGAGELNYSSDIDFSVFFDDETLAAAGMHEPRVAAVRLVAPLVRALEEVTADGYVFRTDLRLRPDPGATPVAVSMASAEHYYQTLGQNWERAAFIKARAAAGDRIAGQHFLGSLSPFIWRKHLDFAAVEDVHSIKRQILSAHKSAELGEPVFDVKLGRGGIRDIELFAQTQQLILGGRNTALRSPGTLAALDALAAAGVIADGARVTLRDAYTFYRNVEHRIQMLEDAHSHRVPADEETRARVAMLAGFETPEKFDAALVAARAAVAEIDRQLFGREESLADPSGSLSFTGVEDNSDTLLTIERLGYKNAAFVSQTIRGWHHGRVRAMRSARARELLTLLTPRLLRALASAGDGDHAFVRFASFFGELSAGVQFLALLDARPALLDLLARLLTRAPALSDRLARRPQLMDALIEPRFAAPLAADEPGARTRDLISRLESAGSFEDKLNAARRFHREEAFRIAAQIVEAEAAPLEAGAAFTDLAEACVTAMADAALQAMRPQPGAFVVLGLGKFGGAELSIRSDLDIMLAYEAPDESGGAYYARLTQRIISALSAPTEEGDLYEVDAKLRPSGSVGPVAVRLSSLQHYYEQEAWTWELQALTRLRPIAGDAKLGARVMDTVRATLARGRDEAVTLSQVSDMRARMERERPAKSEWDLKLAPGGLVDIEFISQALQLTWAERSPAVLAANTMRALDLLHQAGALSANMHHTLTSAWRLYTSIRQVAAICLGAASPEAGSPVGGHVAKLCGEGDLVSLEMRVREARNAVREIFATIIGPLGDGAGKISR
ncbi:MAG: bifunctional [glutamine synthetase] adenylyltransferase/[glutamine synthetase]-adenylyl-L-tyrosine phosphorylase [Terricaulis sp.]